MLPTSEVPSAPLGDISQQSVSPPAVSKQVRRRSSFVFNSRSSEDYPSSHDSIYEAIYISATNSEDNGHHRIQLINIPPRNRNLSPRTSGNNENVRLPSASVEAHPVEEVEFKYGHGTPLDTITEQRSYATFNTLTRTHSADTSTPCPFVKHRDSFLLPKRMDRKKSFSLDDLELINKNYHKACAMIEREINKPLPVHEIYARPKTPTHAPPERPRTPPGLPSWDLAQVTPRVRAPKPPATKNRLRRWLGFGASQATSSIQEARPSSREIYRAMSSPVRSAPRFRPSRSAYGNLNLHPFFKAETDPTSSSNRGSGASGTSRAPPNEQTLSSLQGRRLERRVRFTPSATARDSENLLLQTAVESSSATAIHPLSPMQASTRPASPLSAMKCPHRKGRRAAMKAMRQTSSNSMYNTTAEYNLSPRSTTGRFSPSTSLSASPDPISYTSSRRASLNPDATLSEPEFSGTLSASSSVHLLEGNPSPKPKVVTCWKCKLDSIFARIDRTWERTTICMCFYCCGYDVEDDGTFSETGTGGRYGRPTVRGGPRGEQDFAPRVVTLWETPNVVV